MNKILIGLVCIGLIAISGCAENKTQVNYYFKMTKPKDNKLANYLTYKDSIITVKLNLVDRYSLLDVSVINNSDGIITIVRDECSISNSGAMQRIVSKTTAFAQRDAYRPSVQVPAGCSYNEQIAPANNVYNQCQVCIEKALDATDWRPYNIYMPYFNNDHEAQTGIEAAKKTPTDFLLTFIYNNEKYHRLFELTVDSASIRHISVWK